jgi:membrane protease YdiL (CAAX protease family)
MNVLFESSQLIHFFHKELEGIYPFLKRNGSEAVVISFATLFLVLNRYHPLLPILVIIALLRRNPLDFGLRFGNPKIWGFYVVITCLVGVPVLYAASRIPSFQSYYGIERFDLSRYFLVNCAGLFASEFLFRGFLLFGLKGKLKEGSILIQTIPFVLIHFGKPELETLSTIITGLYFGYIAYHGNSYWPVFIIHLFINVFFVAAVNLL